MNPNHAKKLFDSLVSLMESGGSLSPNMLSLAQTAAYQDGLHLKADERAGLGMLSSRRISPDVVSMDRQGQNELVAFAQKLGINKQDLEAPFADYGSIFVDYGHGNAEVNVNIAILSDIAQAARPPRQR